MVNWANIGNAFTKLGSGLMQTAATSYVLRNSTHCGGSIFGFGGGCFGGRMGFGMPSMYNPMSNPMGIGVFSPNTYNPINNQYGNALAYQWGASLAQQAKMNNLGSMYQQQQTTLQKTDNKYAGDIDENQDTTKGQEYTKETNKLVDEEGNAIKDKSYTISTPKDKEQYKNDLSELGKSYLADIDKSVGNGDGEISLDEFASYEMKNGLPSKADAAKKSQAWQLTQIAFSKLDQNGDNKLDWKEMAAAMATFDTDTTGKAEKDLDGKITSTDYETWSQSMVNQSSNIFDNAVRKNYEQLFGQKTEEETD